jgi:hypothetical protein
MWKVKIFRLSRGIADVAGGFLTFLKFWLQASFEPTCRTSSSEFRNFEIPLKTQESKNFEISFENFQKLLDCSKFGKRCLLGISIQYFF